MERHKYIMGLAASQAKLLSITSRLSDNELRSQSITAAKLSLTNQTSEASRKYINALNTNEYIYRTYNEDGDKVYVPLTGTQLTSYGELKNQYCLVNPAGQILVSELDAANYQNSANINEFLSKYGVDSIPTGESRTVENPAYAEALENYTTALAAWQSQEPDKVIVISNESSHTEVVEEAWTERVHTSALWDQVMNTGCISGSLNNTNCYMHVMASLLGPGSHTTSSGVTYEITSEGENCSEHNRYWCWNTDQHPVDSSLIEELKSKTACGETHDESVDIKYGGSIYHVNCKDSDCDGSQTVYQKITDLLWEIHDDYDGSSTGGPAVAEHIAQFWHIVEFDLDEATEVEHPAVTETIIDTEYQEEPNPKYDEWLSEKPVMEDVPALIDEAIYEYNDKDKAQWYVNLWHRMNGASQEKDGLTTTTTSTTSVINTTTTLTTNSTTGRRWDILEDGLMNSQQWLKYAIETGGVTLERVNYTNPTEEGTGLKYATWTSIVTSNALDISEQQDDTAIARAEAEYEQKQREIEAKDKQYDSMLKLLDTEHNALQTEYESVKSVITKNMERTLKIYQA